jgi:hypothetical protein
MIRGACPDRAGRRPSGGRKSRFGPMCDECEEIEPLTVAYFGKMERKGWRPPAAAKTVPLHDDRVVSGRPYAMPMFACEPADAREVD